MSNDLDDLTSETLNAQRRKAFATFVQELVKADGDPFAALAGMERRLPGSRHVLQTRRAIENSVTKTAVSAMGAGASGGTLLTGEMAAGIIVAATPYSIPDRGGFVHVPFERPIPIGETLIASGMVEPGRAKPLRKGDFDTTTLHRRTAVAIIAIPAELARAPQALPMLSALLARGNGAGLSAAFISEIVVGASPVSSSTDPAADVAALVAAYPGAMETAVVVMSSRNAVAAKLRSFDGPFRDLTRSGGFVAGLPAVCSDAAGDIVAVIDSARVLVADDGEVAVDIARNATLQMEDAPTNATIAGSPAEPVATSLVSLWQTNTAALRIERFINWEALSNSVAYMNADWLS
jgi:hypothetical protein